MIFYSDFSPFPFFRVLNWKAYLGNGGERKDSELRLLSLYFFLGSEVTLRARMSFSFLWEQSKAHGYLNT